jgi:hypothetical protein
MRQVMQKYLKIKSDNSVFCCICHEDSAVNVNSAV